MKVGIVLFQCRYWFTRDGENFSSIWQSAEAELLILEFLSQINFPIPRDGQWFSSLAIVIDNGLLHVRWEVHYQNEFFPEWVNRCVYAFPEYQKSFNELIEKLEKLYLSEEELCLQQS